MSQIYRAVRHHRPGRARDRPGARLSRLPQEGGPERGDRRLRPRPRPVHHRRRRHGGAAVPHLEPAVARDHDARRDDARGLHRRRACRSSSTAWPRSRSRRTRRRCTRRPSASSASGPRRSRKIALETVQGHLRAILGTMSVEDIYKNRDQFAQKVQEVSAGDLANMGLGIDSFTIRDIRDKHGYLEALGKPRIAEVKRTAAIAEAIALKEAAIAQADAERETRERQAEAQKLAQEAEAKRDAAVAEANADKQRRQREADATSHRAAEIANFQAAAGHRRAAGASPTEARRSRDGLRAPEEDDGDPGPGAGDQAPGEGARRDDPAPGRRQALRDRDAGRAPTRTRIEAEAGGRAGRGSTTIAEGEKARGLAAAAVAPGAGRGRKRAVGRRRAGLAEAEAQQGAGPRRGARPWRRRPRPGRSTTRRPCCRSSRRSCPRSRAPIAEPLSTHRPHHDGEHRRQRRRRRVARSPPRSRKVIAQVPPVVESLTGLNVDDLLKACVRSRTPTAAIRRRARPRSLAHARRARDRRGPGGPAIARAVGPVRSPYLDAVRRYGPGTEREAIAALQALRLRDADQVFDELDAKICAAVGARGLLAEAARRRAAGSRRRRSRRRGGGSTRGPWRSTSRRWRRAIPPRTSPRCGCT